MSAFLPAKDPIEHIILHFELVQMIITVITGVSTVIPE